MTLSNVQITREEFAEISRAARSQTFRASTFVPLLAIVAAYVVGSMAAEIIRHSVHEGPPLNVCGMIIGVLPFVLLVGVMLYFIYRPRPQLWMTGMPPAPPIGLRATIVNILLPIGLVVTFVLQGFVVPPDPPPPENSQPPGLIQSLVGLLPWLMAFALIWVTVFRLMRSTNQDLWERQPELHRPQNIHIAQDYQLRECGGGGTFELGGFCRVSGDGEPVRAVPLSGHVFGNSQASVPGRGSHRSFPGIDRHEH